MHIERVKSLEKLHLENKIQDIYQNNSTLITFEKTQGLFCVYYIELEGLTGSYKTTAKAYFPYLGDATKYAEELEPTFKAVGKYELEVIECLVEARIECLELSVNSNRAYYREKEMPEDVKTEINIDEVELRVLQRWNHYIKSITFKIRENDRRSV